MDNFHGKGKAIDRRVTRKFERRVLIAFCLILATAALSFGARRAVANAAHEVNAAVPVTMTELAKMHTAGVEVAEVSDYVFGNYAGDFSAPTHADLNPKKAFVIFWKDFNYRFVFSHEASYCPWFELPSGAALSYQFFEGNEGWAELFNNYGRKEKNSFVDIIERGPQRVWVRWTYFGVNMESGAPAYRGVEDFWAFPNGLILRRQQYFSLMPNDNRGYAREPIETIVMNPVGKLWFDTLAQADSGESRAFIGIDPFSRARIDILWKRKMNDKRPYAGTSRRTGAEWKAIDDAPGFAGIIPLRDGSPFFVIGDHTGFPHDATKLKEHSDKKGTGGQGWGTLTWDHWPIGWLNSQDHPIDWESYRRYPSHFSPFGLDLWSLPNKATEGVSFYSLLGVGGDAEEIRKLARVWLRKGAASDPLNASRLRAISSIRLKRSPTRR